ncbi:hypothetical protein BDK51DRAFT_15049, partial [Blyttiomyces helicus]
QYEAMQALKAATLQQLANADAASNAADFFEHCVDRHGDALCVSAVDHKARYSFNELDAAANRFAWWGLSADVNLRPLDTVALLMENRPEFLAITMGLAKIGVTIALLNTNLTGALLRHAVEVSGARVVIASAVKSANWISVGTELSRPVDVWWYAGEGAAIPSVPVDEGSVRNWKLDAERLAALPAARVGREARHGVDARTPLYYIFTSGTTGPSKAAKFSHKRFIGAAVTWAGPSGLQKGDPYYITLPLYHGNAGVVAVAPCYLLGNPIVLREKFSASNFFKDIREHNVSTPSFSPLRVAIGNGLRADIWSLIQARFHITQVVEHYGSTEMPGDAILNYLNRPGSCGFLPAEVALAKSTTGEGGVLVRYDVEADAVVRDSATGFCIPCVAGEVGEMIMRLPDGLYDGYVGDAATRRKLYEGVFEEGDRWWSSGDLLQTDELGFFYFVDRAGDSF